MKNKSPGILVFFLFFSMLSTAQERVCTPNVWKGEVIKGIIYLENGDSLQGKFTHLTPYNDIKTTHILYQGPKKKKEAISRKVITAYYDKKLDEYRMKVYVDNDSVHVKKNCFFDQGRFLRVIVKGEYNLLKDELTYQSSITAYSQSSSDEVYYILPPSGILLKVQINDLKAQILSIVKEAGSSNVIANKEDFTVDDMIEALNYINSN